MLLSSQKRSGPQAVGSFVHTLVLTDVASGWTECIALPVREQALIVEAIKAVRIRLPFPLLGLDTDNDSAFMNDTLWNYCHENELVFTRSRAYRKNDQAWVEQKNGAIVRKLIGYGRLEGLGNGSVAASLRGVATLCELLSAVVQAEGQGTGRSKGPEELSFA
jgi:hypothetical protein